MRSGLQNQGNSINVFSVRFSLVEEETENAKNEKEPLSMLKTKATFVTLRGEKALVQVTSEYDVHVNQIQTWRNQLKENMISLFDSGIEHHKDQEAELKALQTKTRSVNEGK